MAEFTPLLMLLGLVIFLVLTLVFKKEESGTRKTSLLSKDNKIGGGLGSKLVKYFIGKWISGKSKKTFTKSQEYFAPGEFRDPKFTPSKPIFKKSSDPKEIIEPVFPDKQDAYQMLKDYKKLRRLIEMAIVKLDDLENPKFWENKANEAIKTGSIDGMNYAPMVQECFGPIRKFLEEYRA